MNYDWERLKGLGFDLEYIEKATGDLKEACWKGYTAIGLKPKGNRMVPNCVPIKKSEHAEKYKLGEDSSLDAMVPRNLSAATVAGGGDLKNPQMGEHKIRMPRKEVLEKENQRSDHLAMQATINDPTYSEEYGEHVEPYGRMAINLLRVIREKVDIMLGMMEPDDELEPWMATKIATSAQSLASVADYMRFGVEFAEGAGVPCGASHISKGKTCRVGGGKGAAEQDLIKMPKSPGLGPMSQGELDGVKAEVKSKFPNMDQRHEEIFDKVYAKAETTSHLGKIHSAVIKGTDDELSWAKEGILLEMKKRMAEALKGAMRSVQGTKREAELEAMSPEERKRARMAERVERGIRGGVVKRRMR